MSKAQFFACFWQYECVFPDCEINFVQNLMGLFWGLFLSAELLINIVHTYRNSFENVKQKLPKNEY